MSYFNSDQQSYMKNLAILPREAKCKCGWYEKWDCYDCNVAELVKRGGDWAQKPDPKGGLDRITLYFIPGADHLFTYPELRKWLQASDTQFSGSSPTGG